jgi:acyl-CoA thioesterase I
MRAFKTLSKLALTFLVALFITACADSGSTTTAASKPKKASTIMIFGDSTSQGYGIEMLGTYYENVRPGTIYGDLLITRLREENIAEFAPITVVNASLGSEFTSQAIDRLPALLAAYRPTHVVLAHGTNDAGSGYPNSYMASNFTTMINMVKNSGAKALLADVTFTRYGTEFANAYSQMIFKTAATTGATYVPILNGIAGNPAYYLEDGFHQNEEAQPFMLNNLWAKLIPLLD